MYKGRKKKSIEYFAIKSVDKSQKNKLLQEVSSHFIISGWLVFSVFAFLEVVVWIPNWKVYFCYSFFYHQDALIFFPAKQSAPDIAHLALSVTGNGDD